MKNQYLAVAAIVALTGGAVVWQAASTAASATQAPTVAKSAPVSDGVLRASEFPGVSTVSIPDAPAVSSQSKSAKLKKSADGKSWVRVLPGGKIPAGGFSARNQTTWHRENGKTPLGGIALVPDQNYLLHETARRDAKGALIHECAPGETAAQHAQHRAKKSVVKSQH